MSIISRYDFDNSSGADRTLQVQPATAGAHAWTKAGGPDTIVPNGLGEALTSNTDTWATYRLESISAVRTIVRTRYKPSSSTDTVNIDVRRQPSGACYRLAITGYGSEIKYSDGSTISTLGAAVSTLACADPFTSYDIDFEAADNGATVDLTVKLNGTLLATRSDANLLGIAGAISWDARSLFGSKFDFFEVNDGAASSPVLTSPSGTATGPTQATIGVTSDTAPTTTAISYQILAAATGAPSAATIVGAPDGTISTGSAGALTKAITGLATNTAVKVHFAQGTSSNVVSSASFTPSTLASSGTLSAQTGVQGTAFVWTGATPASLFSGGVGTRTYAASGLAGSGLTTDSATGVPAGTSGTPGTYNVTVTGTDQSTAGSPQPQTATTTYTLTIGAPGSMSLAATIGSFTANLDLARAPGTVAFGPLGNGSGSKWVRNDVSVIVRDRTTEAVVATFANVNVTSSGGSVSSTSLTAGALYRVGFKIPADVSLPNGAKGDADLVGS